MTEQNKTPLTAQPGRAPAPEQKPAEKRPAEKPLRRVGSLTLGACLIAAGVFFLLYFFVPGFDVQLTLKIAPAVALVLLGCEVLFFAARPGRWKYDFVSVLVCLVLMAGCFCMAMLPMLWDELSGENQQTMNRLSAQAIDELYTACKQDAQDIPIRDISGRMFLSGPQAETLQQAAALPAGDTYLTWTVELGRKQPEHRQSAIHRGLFAGPERRCAAGLDRAADGTADRDRVSAGRREYPRRGLKNTAAQLCGGIFVVWMKG